MVYAKNKKIKRNNKKNWITAFLVALALILAGSALYVIFIRDDSAAVIQEQQEAAAQVDVDIAKQRVEEESQDEPLKDGNADDTPPVVSGPVTISSPSFSQSDGLINSSVAITGADSGTCTFIFTDGDGRAISKNARLSSGNCSVSASEAEFTMIGGYNLTVKFGDKSVTKTVNIN